MDFSFFAFRSSLDVLAYFNALKPFTAIGTASRNDSKSAQAWHISTPRRPKKCGRMIIKGMKNRPLREEIGRAHV